MRYTNYKFDVPREKIIRLIMDTDAKNEADDQFAIVHGLLSPKFEHVGVIATHFGNERFHDSMERSYDEVVKLFEIMNFENKDIIYKGATHSLPNEYEPVISEGALLIVNEAMKSDEKLYLAFMGPLTDIASAFLLEPRIKERVILVWIGGGSYPNGGVEFNLKNDINAANVVFRSGIEVWQVPKNVYEMIPVSFAELELRVEPHGAIGNYLFEQLKEHAFEEIPRTSEFRSGESWVLGDTPSIGLLLYEHRFEYKDVIPPIVNRDMSYSKSEYKHSIRVYDRYDPRLFMEDFYAKLELFDKNN